MSRFEGTPDLSTLPGMELKEGEPVFAEPWEAQAFALCISLHAKGVFTWSQWADALSAQIKADNTQSYYKAWLAALETLLAQNGLVTAETLDARTQDWHEAAARTPHGAPIELKQKA